MCSKFVQLCIEKAMLNVVVLTLVLQSFGIVYGDHKFLSLNCTVLDPSLAEFEICSFNASSVNIALNVKRPVNKIFVSLTNKETN